MTRPTDMTAHVESQLPDEPPTGDSDEPPQRLCVDVVVEGGDWSAIEPAEALVLAAAAAVERHRAFTRLQPTDATLALASDQHIQDLNRQFRGKDSPTNVLSFPSGDAINADSPHYLGDIILAAETVAREARELAIPPQHHFQHLVVHGLLHLLGFDHEIDADAELMEAFETEILADLDIPDPYAGSDPLLAREPIVSHLDKS